MVLTLPSRLNHEYYKVLGGGIVSSDYAVITASSENPLSQKLMKVSIKKSQGTGIFYDE